MNQSASLKWERYFLLAIALFFILAPHPGVDVSNNSALYLSEAGQLYQGMAPTILKDGLVARGPVFSYLLAGVFAFTGLSVGATFLLMKAIFVLLIIGLYLAARAFYGASAAFISVILATVSFRIYLIGTAIDTNSVLTFLLLLFVASIFKIWKSGDIKSYVESAVWLSIAYLIKETSLVYLPLLIFSFFYPKAPVKRIIHRICAVTIPIVLILLPWVIYVYNTTSSVLPVLGHFNPEFQKDFSSKIGNNITQGFFQNSPSYLFRFFSEMLPEATWLYLPIIVVLAWHVVHTIIKRTENKHIREDVLLVSAILLYLPIPMSDMAASSGDARQAFVIYFILFILSGKWISIGLQKLNVGIPKISMKTCIRLALVLVGLMAIVVITTIYYPFKHPFLLKLQKAVRNYNLIPEIKDRYTHLHKESADWLSQNLTGGDSIITDGYYDEPFRFFTSNKFQTVISFPARTSHEYQSSAKPVFLITYKKFRQTTGADRFFWVIDEQSILQNLKPGKLVVFSHQSGFLAEYFDQAPWASLVQKNNDTFIYRIKDVPVSIGASLNTFINEEFVDDMEWAKINDPKGFSRLREFLRSHDLQYPDFVKNATVLKAGKYL